MIRDHETPAETHVQEPKSDDEQVLQGLSSTLLDELTGGGS